MMELRKEHECSDRPNMTVVDRQDNSDHRTLKDDLCDVEGKNGSKTVTLSKLADTLQSANPVISNVAVTNSENVQFGNNTYFNGPVVIKQIIQSNSGLENVAYTKTEAEDLSNNIQPSTPSKCDTSAARGFHIKMWHKIVMVLGGVVTVSLACSLALIGSDANTPSNSSHTSFGGTNQVVVDSCNGIHWWLIIFTLFVAVCVILFIPYAINRRRGGGGKGQNAQTGPQRKFITPQKAFQKYNLESVGQANGPATPKYTSAIPTSGNETLITAKFFLRMLSRDDWLAQPPSGVLDRLVHPVPMVIIAHTATEPCYTEAECILRTRKIQSFHIDSKKWFDIAYNFLVGGDGSAYHGRGWDYVGAHTKGYNSFSIGIAFIGTFISEEPTSGQIEACQKLLKIGVALGKLDKNYRLLAHQQLWAAESPGAKVFNIIKEWPHFEPNATGITEKLRVYREKLP